MMGALYLCRKAPKKGKKGKKIAENQKGKCAGNRKMTSSFETQKTCKYLRKTVFENCRNRKADFKSCGKLEHTQKTMKSGENPDSGKKIYGKPEKHQIFHGKPETDRL